MLGDVIQRFNGKTVHTQQDLFTAMDECKVGETVKLEVLRNGPNGLEKRTVNITLAERSRGSE